MDVYIKETERTNWRDNAKVVDLGVKNLVESTDPAGKGRGQVVIGGLPGAGHSWTPSHFKYHRTASCLQVPTGTSLL